MTEGSPQFDRCVVSGRCSLDDGVVLKVVVHVPLAPRRVTVWRMRADTELRAHGSEIWVTREGRLDDYWLRMGDIIRLKRGERIWLSADGGEAAHVTFTSECIDRRAGLRRWIGRLRAWFAGGMVTGV